MILNRWTRRTFPELDRYDDRREAWRALANAFGIIGQLTMVLGLVPILIGEHLFTKFVLVPRGLYGWGYVIFSPGVFYTFACLWMGRRRIRVKLRQQLAQRGVAICVQCGYDTRDLTEDRCPECGTPFEPIEHQAQDVSGE